MPTLTFSYDTGSVPLSRITDAICLEYGYSATILDGDGSVIPNPETKALFAKRMMRQVIVNIVKNQEEKLPVEAAKAGVIPITLT